jgi:ferredoxin
MSESFLHRYDAAAWAGARDAILPSVHEVDRNATRIWFQFFPLALSEAFARSETPEQLSTTLRLYGNYRLAMQADRSHWFFYGHRYWPQVKAAIVAAAESNDADANADLVGLIRQVAKKVATAAGADESLVLGITAAGMMTLRQIGLPAFTQTANTSTASSHATTKSPDAIVAARKKDDSQGLFGFLRGPNTRYTVRFDERRDAARFSLMNQQHLTTAAALDTRDYSSGDRHSHEGPIPSDCRSASCGTCWVGILGGADKLSEVEPLEARRLREFGYLNSSDPKPFIRLSCMARASGNVTLVIPPWHGLIGKAGIGSV